MRCAAPGRPDFSIAASVRPARCWSRRTTCKGPARWRQRHGPQRRDRRSGGLLGSGRTEVARAVFGADPAAGESARSWQTRVRWKSPRDAIRAGFGLCSEDRKADGIIPYMSVRENLTLAALPALSRNGIVDRAEQRKIVDRFIERLGIKTAGPEQTIRELSGGNQQKVLLARWLCLNPSLLLLDEPTRGIDVGAKAEIQGLIDELADTASGC